MASTCHVSLFQLVAISLSLLVYSPPTAAAQYAPFPSPMEETASEDAPPKLVEEVCNRSGVSEFCVEALESDPRTASAPDLLSIAKIALDLAKTNATSTRNYIDGMLKRDDTKPALRPALEKCASSYELVFASFSSAHDELEEDPMTANYDALIAGDYISSCDEELSSGGVSVPSISAKNQVMMYFVRIGDTVTDLLRTNVDLSFPSSSHQ
ncbi:Cell wall / vacuolar inhibitor of fructosidase 2 [Morella rubra]|uniref:Cell wall / vacuolar inhibitor of fructosidase 2 n=1 Tax=Morella rubra TaxID=262757 RepID=A0A6A1UKQ0_9ROSI|nr:Cell wall / vacuolar inhibitor of fructosidase 2 [Morella rubra]